MSRLQRGLHSPTARPAPARVSRLAARSPAAAPIASRARASRNSNGSSTANSSTSSICRASAIWTATLCAAKSAWSSSGLCDTENPLLNRMERERLIDEVLDETFGFGPLEVLLKDPTISDILINGPHKIYVERRGKLEKTDVKFRDNDHLMQIIDRIVSKVGRRVDETSPDGGRPSAGRLPRQRHHSAAGPGRRRRCPFAASAPIRSSWKTC